MRELFIDLETYSDVDISKCGAYKYAESDHFEILLFGVSVDGGPVRVYDLACGESLPEEILVALSEEAVTKWAFNATFERVCLSNWLRKYHPEHFRTYGSTDDSIQNYLDPSSWKCTMIWSAYMGLPLSLEGVGTVLKLQDQKLKEGKDLIRYFCTPCSPTKSNGGRTRNLPEHAPEKWELFKKYNQRDVEVEMQIHNRLGNHPVPDTIWEEYHLDQKINDRGIMIDRTFVKQAIRIDERVRNDLIIQMQNLTGLENPNSVQQLKEYFSKKGMEIDSLGKKEVAEMIKTAPADIARVLSLRLQLAKSSVKKYQAMINAVCADNRCHGMFQFYGANRSGRWAGRLIQLQNLPQNHMSDLAEARELVRSGDYDTLSLLYDDIPDTLSQLIRTAFIARPGYKFIVSDYSAIEARVLAHLAGETWRTKVFAEGGDIYCASASQMFHVPVEKHGINGHLRQKGKQAELACIAEGELVLTNHGLIPIEDVKLTDLLWDGESWVKHEGVIYKGNGEVITYEGLTATRDHLVWVKGKPQPIQFGIAASCGAHLLQTGDGRRTIWMGGNHQSGKTLESELEPLLCTDEVHRMRCHSVAAKNRFNIWKVKWMPELFTAKTDSKMAVKETYCCETTLRESERQGLPQLRSKRNSIRFPQRPGCRIVSDQGMWSSGSEDGNRPDRQQRELCAGEPSIRSASGELRKSAEKCAESVQTGVLAICKKCSHKKIVIRSDTGRDYPECRNRCYRKKEKLENHQRTARLYDIRNAGQYHRFTVSGKLVHNCGYGGSVGALKSMGAIEMGIPEDELQGLVNSWRTANPSIVRFWWDVDHAVKTAVKERIQMEVRGIRFFCKSGMLFIRLPSGRCLSYVKPRIGENQFGGESVTYEGIGTTKKWERIESYGPKFVENIVQAVSRDLLCYALQNLSNYKIVGHVHDEVIIECPQDIPVDELCEIMSKSPPWMLGILIRGDGYQCGFYKKDG